MKRITLIILAVSALLAFAGCKDDRTSISSILQKPDAYMSKEVLIAGNVTKTYAVNLVIAEFGAYQLDDGSGKMWVITKTGVPEEGSKVGLKGTVSSGLKLAGESLGAVIKEQERKTR